MNWSEVYYFHKNILCEIEKIIVNLNLLYSEDIIEEILEFQSAKSILENYENQTLKEFINSGDKLVTKLEDNMKNYYEKLMYKFKNKTVYEITQEVKYRLLNNEYCFRPYIAGKHYYFVESSDLFLGDWAIKPEFYDVVKPDFIEKIALMIDDIQIEIDEVPRELTMIDQLMNW